MFLKRKRARSNSDAAAPNPFRFKASRAAIEISSSSTCAKVVVEAPLPRYKGIEIVKSLHVVHMWHPMEIRQMAMKADEAEFGPIRYANLARAFAKDRGPSQNMKADIAPMPIMLGRPVKRWIATKPQTAAKK